MSTYLLILKKEIRERFLVGYFVVSITTLIGFFPDSACAAPVGDIQSLFDRTAISIRESFDSAQTATVVSVPTIPTRASAGRVSFSGLGTILSGVAYTLNTVGDSLTSLWGNTVELDANTSNALAFSQAVSKKHAAKKIIRTSSDGKPVSPENLSASSQRSVVSRSLPVSTPVVYTPIVVTASGLSTAEVQALIDGKISALQSKIDGLSAANIRSFQIVGAPQKIDTLTNVAFNGGSVNGASVSGTTGTFSGTLGVTGTLTARGDTFLSGVFSLDAATGLARFGDGVSTHVLNQEGDVLVSHDFEVLGGAYVADLSASGDIVPTADIASDIGSLSHRFNNIYAANIITDAISTAGQAIFTFEPATTNFAASSVLINPTHVISGSSLLGIGVGGSSRFLVTESGHVTAAGNLTLESASRFFYDASTHRLGLGTATPSYLLDVNGTARFASGLVTPKISPASDSTSAVQITRADGTTPVLSVDTTNGYVGVGTTSPIDKLDIIAPTYSSGGMRVSGTNGSTSPRNRLENDLGYYLDTRVDGSAVAGNFLGVARANAAQIFSSGLLVVGTQNANDFVLSSNNTERMRITSDGNVGIGTTSPAQKLDIASGNIRVGDTTYASQYGILYKGSNRFLHNFNYGLNGNGVTTDGNNLFLGVNAGNFTMGSTATTSGEASRNTGIGYTALSSLTTGYQNNAIGSSALKYNSTGAFNNAMGADALMGNESGSHNTAVGGYSLNQNTTGSYNTAIGFNAGRYQADGLTVLTDPENSVYIGAGVRGYSNGDSNSIVIGYNAIGLGANTVVLGNSDITTTALRGNVGIGTTSPGGVLDVISNPTYSSGVRFGSFNQNPSIEVIPGTGSGYLYFKPYYGQTVFTTNSGSAVLQVQSVSGDNILSGYGNNLNIKTRGGAYDIVFSPNEVEKVRIDNTGNVGINTTTPTAKLQVKGAGTTTGVNFQTLDSAGTALITGLDNGNVGIGTSSPAALLDVNGNLIFRGSILNASGMTIMGQNNYYPSAGTAGAPTYAFNNNGSTGLFGSNTTNGGFIGFSAMGTEVMRVANNGNVGIGTTSPVLKLEVDAPAGLPATSGTTQTGIFRTRNSVGNGVLDQGQTAANGGSWLQATNAGNLSLNYPIYLNPNGGAVGIGYTEVTGTTGALLINGNVGIGTTSPLAQLTLVKADSSGLTDFLINPTAKTSGNFIDFQINGNSQFLVSNTGSMILNTAGYNTGGTITAYSKIATDTLFDIYTAVLDRGAGNGGTGLGLGYDFQLENGAGNRTDAGRFKYEWTDPTAAAEYSKFTIQTKVNGAMSDSLVIKTGNVGIGTTDPKGLLSVATVASGSVPNTLVLSNNSLTDGSGVGINFNLSTTMGFMNAKIQAARDPYGSGASNISFWTSDIGNSATEKIRISREGNLGIGTTSPAKNLDVYPASGVSHIRVKSADNEAQLYTDSGGATRNSGIMYALQGTNKWFTGLKYGATNNFSIYEVDGSDASRFTILPGGNVGIGTTSPSALLQIGAGGVSGTTLTRGLVLTGTFTDGATQRHQNLLSFKATTSLNADPFADTGSEGIKNFHLGLVGDSSWFNSDRFSIIQGGTERLSINTSGRVGIGTTSPGYALDVASGNIGTTGDLYIKSDTHSIYLGSTSKARVSSTITGDFGFNYNTGATGGLSFYGGGTGLVWGATNVGNTTQSGTLTVSGTGNSSFAGNVGIGTTNPKNRLQISASSQSSAVPTAGTINTTTSLYLTNDDANYGLLGGILNSGRAWLQAQRTDGTATAYDLFLNPNGGNVGIGTTSPNRKLTVNGIISGSNESYVDGDGSFIGLGGAPSFIQRVQRTSGEFAYSLFKGYGDNTTTGRSGLLLDYGVNGHLGDVSNNPAINYSYFSIGPSAAYTNTWMRLYNNANKVVSFDGNVGIGTTSPEAKLHVVGGSVGTDFLSLFTQNAVTAESSATVGSNANKAVMVQGDGGAYFMGRDVTNDIEFAMGTSVSGVAFAGAMTAHDFQLRTDNTTRVTIQKTTGDVGIGTTSPNGKLQIAGDVSANPNTGVYAQLELTGSTNPAKRLGLGYNTTGNYGFIQAITNASTFDKLILSPNGGNVGIGTTSPLGTLHAKVGTTAVTATSYDGYFENLATNTTTDAINKYGLYVTSTGSFTGSSGTATNNYGLYVNTPTGADNNYAAIFAGGNVGIGITNPSAKLDVSGDIKTTSSGVSKFYANNSGLIGLAFNGTLEWSGDSEAANAGDVGFARDAAGVLKVTDGGTGLGTLTASNVGIGTTSPSAPLTIQQTNDTAGFKLIGNSDPSTIFSFFIGSGGTNNPRFDSTKAMVFNAANGLYFRSGSTGIYFNDTFARVTDFNNGQVVITSTGNVGIGTTSPTNILSLGNAADRKFWIEDSASGTVGRALTVAAGGTVAGGTDIAGGNMILQSGLGTGTGASTISFQTGTTLGTGTTLQTMSTKMTILGNGNVGIGTTVPETKLYIEDVAPVLTIGATSNNRKITFSPANGALDSVNAYFHFNRFSNYPVVIGQDSTAGLGIGGTPTSSGLYVKGNVGIGTTAPSYLLSLGGTAARTFGMERNSTAGTQGLGLTITSGGAIAGTADLAGGDLTFKSGISTGTGSSAIHFLTAAAGSTGTTDNAPTEKMTILGNGNVGIGTTNPGRLLTVSGDVQAGTFYAAHGAIQVYTHNGLASLYQSSGAALEYWDGSNAIQGLVLKNTGNVGIGTTTPDELLHIQKDSDVYLKMQAATGSGQIAGIKLQRGLSTDSYTDYDLYVSAGDFKIDSRSTGANINRVTIKDSTGNVGIGTTSPQFKLDVYGTIGIGDSSLPNTSKTGYIISRQYDNTQPGFATLNSYSNSGNNQLYFGGGSGSYNAATQLLFYTAANNTTLTGTARMVINSDGSVGIGTAYPTSKLHLNGTLGALSGGLAFGDGDTGLYEYSDDVLRLATGGSDRLTINASGDATFSGNVYSSAGGSSGSDASYPFATTRYILSRGMNLIVNGSGLLYNNYNFSSFSGGLDQVELYAGGGSFKEATHQISRMNDELIAVDTSKFYRGTAYFKSTTLSTDNSGFFGITAYDIDGHVISDAYHMRKSNTDTTLAATLNPGDTTVTLTSSANWTTTGYTYQRRIAIYDYVNSKGYRYPAYTYTRHIIEDAYSETGISGNVITLKTPYSGAAVPAGTPVSNGQGGATYKYSFGQNVSIPNSWKKMSGTIGGVDMSGTNVTSMFPPGTAFVKLLFLLNYGTGSGNVMNVSSISLTEVTEQNLTEFKPNASAFSSTNYFQVLSVNDESILNVDTNNARVGIGTATPTERLTVYNGTTTGTYTTSGWVHSSDARLKTNIASVASALEAVNKLDGVTFNWIADPNGSRQIGLIAQDVRAVLPEVVIGDEEHGYGIAYGNITALLINAVKELDIKSEDLEKIVYDSTHPVALDDTSLAGRFFDGLRTWFADAENGIETFVTGTLKAKNQICIDDVCLTKEELRRMIEQSGVGEIEVPVTSGGGGDIIDNTEDTLSVDVDTPEQVVPNTQAQATEGGEDVSPDNSVPPAEENLPVEII
ncbi:MAG: tail fiber domain-containing protein [Candidatus Yonathbacteria bacterium]|nr:tail fiber domain-containing protein [Candidatus Yonathbacteria bacterium]